MPTVITLISCVLISQFAVAESPAGAAAERMQATSGAQEHPSADPLTPSQQQTQSPAEQATPAEIPQAVQSRSALAPDDRSMVSTDRPAALRKHPPDLVAEAMALPAGSTYTGQPLALVQALSATADRRQQLVIANAYWQTIEALAKYHYCLDQVDQLGRLQSRREEDASLQAARAAAAAALSEAELAASSAQHELAALVQLPADAPLPLPADRPHVGAYRTNYQELFAQRPGPDRARLIDRTLPIRHMAIDQRAVALQAAQDALTAAIDLCQSGRGSMQSVVTLSAQLLRQQRAFIEAVCRYNRDIAEYAMTVVSPGVTPQALAGYMIKTAREPVQGANGEDQADVQPTSLNQPVPTPATRNENSPIQSPPPRSVPGGTVIPAAPPATRWGPANAPLKNEPTLAPRRDGAMPREKKESAPFSPGGLVPIEGNQEPTLAPPRSEIKPKADNDTSQPSPQGEDGEKIRYSVGDPFSRRVQTTRKSVAELAAAAGSTSSLNKHGQSNDAQSDAASPAADSMETATALYPALVEARPAMRVKQLTLALHWDRSLPDGTGSSMTLEECLSRSPAGDRRAAVEAFWTARQRAAEYQVLAQEIEFLDSLTPLVLQRRAHPQGAAAMLYLRAAQRSARADLEESHAALIDAQFELALSTRTAAESVWPLPATAPHSGQYLLNLEAQPRWVVQSWPTRHLAAAIPVYNSSLQDHAAAVVAADIARVKAWEKYAAGNLPIEQALEESARQSQETFAFLQTLTDYNRAIAQYALMVLPADASPAKVASSLVVQR